MAPIIVYDISNGFKQTVIFLGWVFIYKPFTSFFKYSLDTQGFNYNFIINFLLLSFQKIIFQQNVIISFIVLVSSIFFIIKDVLKKDNFRIENPKFLLLLFLFTVILGILVNKVPSDAYLPIIFPFVIYAVAIFFDHLIEIKKIKYAVIIGFFILISFNFYYSYIYSFKPDLVNRINAVEKIITITKGNDRRIKRHSFKENN